MCIFQKCIKDILQCSTPISQFFLFSYLTFNLSYTVPQRYGVIVLGNPRILARHPLWNAFINHMKDHEALMEGPLTKLVPSMMRFEPPRQRGGPRHNMHGGMDMRGRPPPEGGDKYDSRYDPRFSDNGPGGMGGSGMDGMGGVPPPLFNMPDGGVGDAYGHDGSQSGMSGSHGSFSQDQSDRLSFASGMSQSLSQQSYSSAQSGNYGF